MTRPDDEETKEHPIYGAPPAVPAQPPSPPAEPPAAPGGPPAAPEAPPAALDHPPTAPAPPPATANAPDVESSAVVDRPPEQPAAASQPGPGSQPAPAPPPPPTPSTQPWQPATPPPPPPPPAGSANPQWQGQMHPGQGQWQQPASGPWPQSTWHGGAPPAHAAQQQWAAQHQWSGGTYATSPLVALAAMLLIAFGLLVALIGGWALTQGPEIGRFIRENDIAVFGRQVDRETLRAILSPIPGVLMIIGVLQLVVGAGVFAHKGWARALGVLLAILGLIVGIFAVSASLALAPGLTIPMLLSIVVLLGYAFVLLALIAGGSHFRTHYPRPR